MVGVVNKSGRGSTKVVGSKNWLNGRGLRKGKRVYESGRGQNFGKMVGVYETCRGETIGKTT